MYINQKLFYKQYLYYTVNRIKEKGGQVNQFKHDRDAKKWCNTWVGCQGQLKNKDLVIVLEM